MPSTAHIQIVAAVVKPAGVDSGIAHYHARSQESNSGQDTLYNPSMAFWSTIIGAAGDLSMISVATAAPRQTRA